jgi:hypothetical protein
MIFSSLMGKRKTVTSQCKDPKYWKSCFELFFFIFFYCMKAHKYGYDQGPGINMFDLNLW